MIPYWPTSLPQSILMPHSEAVADTRAVFETAAGPIARRRLTGSPVNTAFATAPMTREQYATFEAWVDDDLAGGAKSFCRRDPVTGDPRMWKMLGGDNLYQARLTGGRKVQVSFSAVRLPSIPWFADYVPDCVSRVPDFVADYANDVYGVQGEKVAASALPDIEGEYLTVTTNASSVVRTVETLTAGDIPATAPAGVTSIIGFLA
jgi:hypothetical protein